MFDDWKWKSYNKVLREAREPTPFKSAAQKRYKRLRRKNDIYTTKAGHKSLGTGAPYSGKMKRFGTDRLRFESLKEIVDDGLDLSSLELKGELSPALWEDGNLKQEIKERLSQVAYDFLDSLGIKVGLSDLYLVGSMAAYNYSEHSDIDLHLILDFDKVSSDKDLLRDYFMLAKSKWNRTRGLILSGHDVEIYVEDVDDERIPSATYSVLNGKWVTEPAKEDVQIDYDGVSKKVNEKMMEVEELEKLFDAGEWKEAYEFGTGLRHKMRSFREAGLEDQGEFSNENLAFKVLRRAGTLDKINDYVKKSYKEMRASDGVQ